MRNILALTVSALLTGCGSGHAAPVGADQSNTASVEPNSVMEAVDSDFGASAVVNAATDPAYMAEAAAHDGHLPANWAHQRGDILVLQDGGFSFAQPGLHPYRYIDFRLPRATVLRGVSIIRGRPTSSGRKPQCRGGPMDFTAFGALVLNFRHGAFVGWELSRPATPRIETFLGLGVGTPRAWAGYGGEDVTSTRNSPRGPQFEVGGIGGFLSSSRPDARVTGLYAGETCFARTPPQPVD